MAALLALWCTMIQGCGDGGNSVTPPESGLTVLSGEGATAQAGAALPNPVRIRVRDETGHPFEGVVVTWEILAGGGSLSNADSETDAAGEATVIWTLGPQAAVNRMRIRAGEFPPVTVESLGWSVSIDTVTFTVPGDSARIETRLGEQVSDSAVLTLRTESRWTQRLPVLSPNALGRGVLLAEAPGKAIVDVRAFGADLGHVEVGMTPVAPAVFDVAQEGWPSDRTVTLFGYRMDEVGKDAITVAGQPATWLAADSATLRLDPGLIESDSCVLSVDGQLDVADLPIYGGMTTVRQSLPLDSLDVGETRTLSAPSFCLRLPPGEPARYAVAELDRVFIDASVNQTEPLPGGDPHTLTLTDHNAEAAKPARARELRSSTLRGRTDVGFSELSATSSHAPSPIFEQDTPWEVGDSVTQDFAPTIPSSWRVAALYPPNLVLAVPTDEYDRIWDYTIIDRLARSFAPIGTDEVQAVFESTFGSSARPMTSPGSGQLLVFLFDITSGAAGVGGCRYMFLDLDQTGLQPDGTILPWQEGHSMVGLISHEWAHGWQCMRNGYPSGARWALEGTADFMVAEVSRVRDGVQVDENRPWQGDLSQTVPTTGDFAGGYDESSPFLRRLTRTLWRSGISWEDARRTALKGAEEGWYGHQIARGPGLTARMRGEVGSGWDPVTARLDWVLSIAVDDRGHGLPQTFSVPDILDTWQVVQATHNPSGPNFFLGTLEAGEGGPLTEIGTRGSNGYALVEDPEGKGVVLEGNADASTVAWKILRFQ